MASDFLLNKQSQFGKIIDPNQGLNQLNPGKTTYI